MSIFWLVQLLPVLLLLAQEAQSFVIATTTTQRRRLSIPVLVEQHSSSYGQPLLQRRNRCSMQKLFGIPEWRDLVFAYPGTWDDSRLGFEQEGPPKEICILTFPYQEALLQGETKQLQLNEERFMKLFDDCMENHCGVMAMGMIDASGIVQRTIALAEVEAYNRMSGFGIFVTIRVVGRADLLEVVQQEPYIKAVCAEFTDIVQPDLDLHCLRAGLLESYMQLLDMREFRWKIEKSREIQDPNDNDRIMKQYILMTKLEVTSDDNYDEEDEDVDVDDKESSSVDRQGRFRRAYEVALATDTQGYQVPAVAATTTGRTAQELTAISWAAFCTELLPEVDATFRMQALDCDSLYHRLKLASRLMRHKDDMLIARMEKADLEFGIDNFDETIDGGVRRRSYFFFFSSFYLLEFTAIDSWLRWLLSSNVSASTALCNLPAIPIVFTHLCS